MSCNVLDILNSCKNFNDITIRQVIVTPFIAEKMLSLNTKNRSISHQTVDRYSRDMITEKWTITSNCVSFDTDGLLIDGQHRLLAIVKSGITVKMVVMAGLSKDAQLVTDRGKVRSVFQILKMAGYNYSSIYSQVARFFVMKKYNHSSKITPTENEILENIAENESVLASVFEVIPNNKSRGICRTGFIAAIVDFYKKHNERSLDFIKKVTTGSMVQEDSPELRLRMYLLSEGGYSKSGTKSTSGSWKQVVDYKKTCYAINKYMAGVKIIKMLLEHDNIQ